MREPQRRGGASPTPAYLTGVAALRAGLDFAADPLVAMRRMYDAHGPCVLIGKGLPILRRPPVAVLNVPLILTAGAAFNLEVLNNQAAWRPISLMPGGPRNSAARRLSLGLMRITGPRHAHYRKLVSAPLRKDQVDAFDQNMVRLVQEEIARWRVGETVDLWQNLYRLTRKLAIGLLFGGDEERGFPIADMISSVLQRKWALSVIGFPVDLPITPYGRLVRDAEALECRILRWADSKRGHLDSRDLASIVVNNPDIDGSPPSDATIAGQVPALYAATAEACQATLFWALLLVAQHPRVAADLLDELQKQPNGVAPTTDALVDLPRLDAVVKETMRILPPVPLQLRAASTRPRLPATPCRRPRVSS